MQQSEEAERFEEPSNAETRQKSLAGDAAVDVCDRALKSSTSNSMAKDLVVIITEPEEDNQPQEKISLAVKGGEEKKDEVPKDLNTATEEEKEEQKEEEIPISLDIVMEAEQKQIMPIALDTAKDVLAEDVTEDTTTDLPVIAPLSPKTPDSHVRDTGSAAKLEELEKQIAMYLTQELHDDVTTVPRESDATEGKFEAVSVFGA
jgi:hypothetical protein